MMHHNTEFWNKMFGGLKNIIWVNIDNLTLRCDLDFECNNPIFPQDAFSYHNLSSDQVWYPKYQQFRRYSSQGNILIIWTLAMTLTLKTANNFCFAWHSGSYCSITIPSLVTKCFVVHKISGQIFTHIFNLCFDLDLERNNPLFPQDTLAYNAVLPNRVWLQMEQQFGRYSRNSHILII